MPNVDVAPEPSDFGGEENGVDGDVEENATHQHGQKKVWVLGVARVQKQVSSTTF